MKPLLELLLSLLFVLFWTLLGALCGGALGLFLGYRFGEILVCGWDRPIRCLDDNLGLAVVVFVGSALGLLIGSVGGVVGAFRLIGRFCERRTEHLWAVRTKERGANSINASKGRNTRD